MARVRGGGRDGRALLLASIALAGWDGWRAFLDFTPVLRKVTLEDADAVWHRNVSVFMAASRLGLGLTAAYAAQIAAALIAAALVALAWFKDAPAPVRNAAVLIGVLLATPYLQDYDLVLGAFIVVWLRCTTPRRNPRRKSPARLILLLPLLASPLAKLTGFAFGPLFVIPALIVTARTIFATPAAAVAARA